jgi:hypothetical protein
MQFTPEDARIVRRLVRETIQDLRTRRAETRPSLGEIMEWAWGAVRTPTARLERRIVRRTEAASSRAVRTDDV